MAVRVPALDSAGVSYQGPSRRALAARRHGSHCCACRTQNHGFAACVRQWLRCCARGLINKVLFLLGIWQWWALALAPGLTGRRSELRTVRFSAAFFLFEAIITSQPSQLSMDGAGMRVDHWCMRPIAQRLSRLATLAFDVWMTLLMDGGTWMFVLNETLNSRSGAWCLIEFRRCPSLADRLSM